VKTLLGIGFLAILLLAGCAGGDIGMICPISGGQTVTVILTSQGPVPAENDDFKVLMANMFPNVEKKQLIYTFGLLAKKGKAPRHVSIEDVSEEKAELLLEEAEPKLDDKQTWRRDAAPKTGDDPRLAWLYHEGNSTRIFRFTIVTEDGRRLVMHQATVYPVYVKIGARKILGMTP
jgi:hypothetical protein